MYIFKIFHSEFEFLCHKCKQFSFQIYLQYGLRIVNTYVISINISYILLRLRYFICFTNRQNSC